MSELLDADEEIFVDPDEEEILQLLI